MWIGEEWFVVFFEYLEWYYGVWMLGLVYWYYVVVCWFVDVVIVVVDEDLFGVDDIFVLDIYVDD